MLEVASCRRDFIMVVNYVDGTLREPQQPQLNELPKIFFDIGRNEEITPLNNFKSLQRRLKSSFKITTYVAHSTCKLSCSYKDELVYNKLMPAQLLVFACPKGMLTGGEVRGADGRIVMDIIADF